MDLWKSIIDTKSTMSKIELIASQYIVRWVAVLSNHFDSTTFKKVMPEVYKAYTKQTTSRRFTISV